MSEDAVSMSEDAVSMSVHLFVSDVRRSAHLALKDRKNKDLMSVMSEGKRPSDIRETQ